MKKGTAFIMIAITVIFAVFTIGVLVGRSIGSGQVIIRNYPESEPTASTAAVSVTTVPAQPTPTAAAAINSASETYPAAASTTVSGKLNINKATLEDLVTLPGIGPALAQRILDHRNVFGPFRYIEELKEVEGIGDKKLAAIAELITTED